MTMEEYSGWREKASARSLRTECIAEWDYMPRLFCIRNIDPIRKEDSRTPHRTSEG